MAGRTVQVVPYSPTLDVRNASALPRGASCRYLLCIRAHEPGVLIAKAWKRKKPAVLFHAEVLVDFKPVQTKETP